MFSQEICIIFVGSVYNIPICIWLMDTHPDVPPICYVKPTADMHVKISMYVDHSGKIYLPYLHDWNRVSFYTYHSSVTSISLHCVSSYLIL